jgi:hypothetical protein
MVKPAQLYKCDIVPPDEIKGDNLRKFLKQAQLTVIKVPVRQRGLTSSGGHLRCWWNVHSLVDVWGGECLLGWHILPKTNSTWHGQYERGKILIHHQLFGHAIWINPEGRASCVTKANVDNLTKLEKNSGGVIVEKNRQYILFAVAKTTKNPIEIPKTNIGIKIDAPNVYIQGSGSKNQFEYKNIDIQTVDNRIQKHLVQKLYSTSEVDIHEESEFNLPSKYTHKSFLALLRSKKIRTQESKLSPAVIFNMKKLQPINSSSAIYKKPIEEIISELALSKSSDIKKRIEIHILARNLRIQK